MACGYQRGRMKRICISGGVGLGAPHAGILSSGLHPIPLPSPRCDDITTCLDGYAEKPTLAQCVALGPLNGISPFRLHESDSTSTSVQVDLITPSGNITGAIPIADVFVWVRKAGEFVKSCASRFSSEGSVVRRSYPLYSACLLERWARSLCASSRVPPDARTPCLQRMPLCDKDLGANLQVY